MLKLQVRLVLPELDSKGYTNALNVAIRRAMKEGAKAFLLAAFPLVPVWTGMSRGSLTNLGRLVGETIPINPNPASAYEQAKGKNKAAGKRLGTPLSKIIQNKRLGNQSIWNFTYQTKVPHYIINEGPGGRSPTSPWDSFIEGRRAFFTAYNLAFDPPDLKKYILKSTHTYGDVSTNRQTTGG